METMFSFLGRNKLVVSIAAIGIIPLMALAWYFAVFHSAPGIHPPLESMNIPYDTLSFQVEQGLQYHHPTGSNITIPASAFVDKNGRVIKGKAHLLYREFHDIEDILLSGIPLGDIQLGKNNALQSAGMFEIKAMKGKEALRLRDGKKINVELAAYRKSDDYSVFRLNDDIEWDRTGNPLTKENTKKLKDCAKIPPIPESPLDPRVNDDDIVFDLSVDYYNYPELTVFKNTRFKLIKRENPNWQQDLWALRVNWEQFKITPFDKSKNLYKLSMKRQFNTYENKRTTKRYSVIVMPVLEGKDYEEALLAFNEQMEQYSATMDLIEKEEERLALEADVLNKFDIDALGVWNIDKFLKNQQFVKIDASFDFEEKINPYFNKIKVYVINKTDNTCQEYRKFEWNNIFLRSGTSTTLMAVLPDNRIAVFPDEEFAKIDFDQVYRTGLPYRFETQIYSADIKSIDDLRAVL